MTGLLVSVMLLMSHNQQNRFHSICFRMQFPDYKYYIEYTKRKKKSTMCTMRSQIYYPFNTFLYFSSFSWLTVWLLIYRDTYKKMTLDLELLIILTMLLRYKVRTVPGISKSFIITRDFTQILLSQVKMFISITLCTSTLE